MKKQTSKRFLILTISASILVVTGVIMACAGGDDFGDFFVSFFAPETSDNESSAPFYRSMRQFYGEEPNYDNSISVMDTANINEWTRFFGRKVEMCDLNYIVYKSEICEIDTSIFYIKNSTYPMSHSLRRKISSLLAYPDKALTKEFLFYLGYAKRCEPYATYNPGWWSYDETDPRDDKISMENLIDGGKRAMINAKTSFIKARYAFQVSRLLFQYGNYEECISFFNDNKPLFQGKSTAYYRALGYVAASHYKLENFSEANYIYSLLFDKCKPMKITAFKSFHPQEDSDWEGALALASDCREKEVLWHMLGIYADPVRAMNEIYKLNPNSEFLDLLLVRAVNINEEYFIPNQDYWSEKSDSYALVARSVDDGLLELAEKVSAEGKADKIYLWNLVAGYLNMAKGNFDKSDIYLSKAELLAQNDILVNEQIHSFRIMTKVERYSKPEPSFEKDLTSELKWLRSDSRNQALRKCSIYDWCLSRLSEKYRSWGDSVKAQCLDYKQNKGFYYQPENMEAMIRYMDKKNKTEFDSFILSLHPYSRGELFEYKAIQLIYQYKFEEALAMFDQSPGSGDGILYGDPFLIHINDCHDCDYYAPQNEQYTKYTFIQRLLELKQMAEEDRSRASEYYFLLANGLYNMTYFGNAHHLFSSPLVDCEVGYFYFGYDRPDDSFRYFDCGMALKYYQKASDMSDDREFKAKCCFMAAKCEQNQYFSSPEFDYDPAVKSGEYFRELYTNYSNTDYFQEVINECGYFKLFVEKSNKSKN